MTTLELAREVERIANEIAAIMAVFPRLNRKDQTTLAIHGDIKLDRLQTAWAQFAAAQWRERPTPQEPIKTTGGTIEIG